MTFIVEKSGGGEPWRQVEGEDEEDVERKQKPEG